VSAYATWGQNNAIFFTFFVVKNAKIAR